MGKWETKNKKEREYKEKEEQDDNQQSKYWVRKELYEVWKQLRKNKKIKKGSNYDHRDSAVRDGAVDYQVRKYLCFDSRIWETLKKIVCRNLTKDILMLRLEKMMPQPISTKNQTVSKKKKEKV